MRKKAKHTNLPNRVLSFFMAAIMVVCIVQFGGSINKAYAAEAYIVEFDLNGAPGEALAVQNVESGNAATIPSNPKWPGSNFEFVGWFEDSDGNSEWDFNALVTENMILYAKWVETYNIDINLGREYSEGNISGTWDNNWDYKLRGLIHLSEEWGSNTISIFPKPNMSGIASLAIPAGYTLKSLKMSANHNLSINISSDNEDLSPLAISSVKESAAYPFVELAWTEAAGNVTITMINLQNDKEYYQCQITDILIVPVSTVKHPVSFEASGVAVASLNVPDGAIIINPPSEPTNSDSEFIFGGWFDNPEFSGTPWDFSTDVVNEEKTFYANWYKEIIVEISDVLANVAKTAHGRVVVGEKYAGIEFSDRWCIAGNNNGIYPDYFEYGRIGTFILPNGFLLKSITFTTGTHNIDVMVGSNSPNNADAVFGTQNTDGKLKTVTFNDWKEQGGVVSVSIDNTTTATPNDLSQFSIRQIVMAPLSSDEATVTFESNGGSYIEPITIMRGAGLNAAPIPTNENPVNIFGGWFIDEELETPWDLKVPNDMIVYAKWSVNRDIVINMQEEYDAGHITYSNSGADNALLKGVQFGDRWGCLGNGIVPDPNGYGDGEFSENTFTLPEGYMLKSIRMAAGHMCDVTINSSADGNNEIKFIGVYNSSNNLLLEAAAWVNPSETVTFKIDNINGFGYSGDITQCRIMEIIIFPAEGFEPPEPSITSVEVTPKAVNVEKGGDRQFYANVTVVSGAPTTVVWEIEGNLDMGTTIDSTGLLSIALGESAATLSIKATSTFNMEKFDTASVTVITPQPPSIESVSIIPKMAGLMAGQAKQFAVDVVSLGNATKAVTWGLSGNAKASTTISANGLLEVDPTETASVLTVKVTSNFDSSKFDTATVNVVKEGEVDELPLLVDCGGDNDAYYSGGNKWDFTNNDYLNFKPVDINVSTIENPPPAKTYETVRRVESTSFTYAFRGLPTNKEYLVRIHIAEPGKNTQGAGEPTKNRVCTYSINNGSPISMTLIVNDLAYVREYFVFPDSDGIIAVKFTEGMVSAIELIEAEESGPVQDVIVTPEEMTIAVTEVFEISAIVLPPRADNKKLVWSSDKPGVASVTQAGFVTGVSVGTATIKATAEDDTNGVIYDTCEITVLATVPVSGLTVSPKTIDVFANETKSLVPTIIPFNASNKKIKWVSNNTSIVTVDDNGAITGVNGGTATITGTADDETLGTFSDTCVVTVSDEIVINVNELTSSIQLTFHGRVPAGAIYKTVSFDTPWCSNGGAIYPDFYEYSQTGSITPPKGFTLKSITFATGHPLDIKIGSSNPINGDPSNKDLLFNNYQTSEHTVTLEELGWNDPSGTVYVSVATPQGSSSDRAQFAVKQIVFFREFDNCMPFPEAEFDASVMKLINFIAGQKYSLAEGEWIEFTEQNIDDGFVLFDDYDDIDIDYGIKVRAFPNQTQIDDGKIESRILTIALSRFPIPEGLKTERIEALGGTGKIVGLDISKVMQYYKEGEDVLIECGGTLGDKIEGLLQGKYHVRYKGFEHTLPSEFVRKDVNYAPATPEAKFEASQMKLSKLNEYMVYKIGGDPYGDTGWVKPTLIDDYAVLTDSEFVGKELVIYVKEIGRGGMSDSDTQDILLTKEARIPTTIRRKNSTSIDKNDGQLHRLTSEMEYKLNSDSSYKSDYAASNIIAHEEGSFVVTGLEQGVYYIRFRGAGYMLPGDYATIDIEFLDIAPHAEFNAATMLLTNVDSSMEYSLMGGLNWKDIEGTSIDFTGEPVSPQRGIWVRMKATAQYDDPVIQYIELFRHNAPVGLTAVNASNGGANGSILGVDSSMEFRDAKEHPYVSISGGEIPGLKEGRYQVRIKGAGHVLPSEPVSVTILQTTIDGVTPITDLSRKEQDGNKYAKNPNSDPKYFGKPLPAIVKVSEGMGQDEAVTVFGEYFTGKVWVKMSDENNEWVIMPEQIDTYGQFVRFVWPDYIPPGIYVIQVSNDDGVTWSVQEGYVNMPNGQWSNDPGIYTGMEVNLFGRNLDARQYDPSLYDHVTRVRFIELDSPNSSSGVLVHEVDANVVTPYRISFTAPEIKQGKYYTVQICVETGGIASGTWETAMMYPDEIKQLTWQGLARPSFNKEEGKPDPNQIVEEMSMSWVTEFKWDNYFDAKEYGAKGDGVTDDTAAINAAIDAAHNAGGGVVYLEEGTYKISLKQDRSNYWGAVLLKEGVILQGVGRGGENDDYLTIIEYDTKETITSGYDQITAIKNSGRGYCGIMGIKGVVGKNVEMMKLLGVNNMVFSCLGGENGVNGASYTNTFVYDCYIDMGINARAHKAAAGNANNVLIANNTLISGRASYHYAQCRNYFTMRDNLIAYGDGNFGIEADYIAFMNNDVQICFTMPDYFEDLVDAGLPYSDISSRHRFVSEDVHGLFIYPVIYGCHYVGQNKMGGAWSTVGTGNCEMIAYDSAIHGKMRSEDIISAGEDWFIYADNYSTSLPNEWEFIMNVLEGEGIGQMRVVPAGNIEYIGGPLKQYKVTVDKPFDVIPGSTSVIVMSRPHINNVVEKNYIYDAANAGVQYYFGCWDNVTYDNTMKDTQGVQIWGGNTNPYGGYTQIVYNTFFTDVRNNRVIGYPRRTSYRANPNGYTRDGGIMERGEESVLHVTPIAPEFYGNEYRNNFVDRVDNLQSGNPGNYGLFTYSHPRMDEANRAVTGRRIAGTLFDRNTSLNNPLGAVGIMQTSIYGVFVRNTVIGGTTPKVAQDNGLNTYFVQGNDIGLARGVWTATASNGAGGSVSNAISETGKWTTTQKTGDVTMTIDTGYRSTHTNGGVLNDLRSYRVVDRIKIDAEKLSGTFKLYASIDGNAWGNPVLTVNLAQKPDFFNDDAVYFDEITSASGRYFKLEFTGISSELSINNVNLMPRELALPQRFEYIPEWQIESEPSAPEITSFLSEGGQVTIYWNEPIFTGRLPINNYEIRVRNALNNAIEKTVPSISPSQTSYVIDGLTDGVLYKFDMRAHNDKGASEWSASVEVMPWGDNPFNLILTESEGGVLASEKTEYNPYDRVTFTIVPNLGKRVVQGSRMITNDSGEAVPFRNTAAGVYEFIMPLSNVTVSCVFENVPEEQPKMQLGLNGNPYLQVLDENGNVIETYPDMNVVYKGYHLGYDQLSAASRPDWFPHGAYLVFEFDSIYDITELYFRQLWLETNEILFEASVDGSSWQVFEVEKRYLVDWNSTYTYKNFDPIAAKYFRMKLPTSLTSRFQVPWGVRITGQLAVSALDIENAWLYNEGEESAKQNITNKVNGQNGGVALQSASQTRYIEIELDGKYEIGSIEFLGNFSLQGGLLKIEAKTDGGWFETGTVSSSVFKPNAFTANSIRIEIPAGVDLIAAGGISIVGMAAIDSQIRSVNVNGKGSGGGPFDGIVYREITQEFTVFVDAVGGASEDVIWSLIGSSPVPGRPNEVSVLDDNGVLSVSKYETAEKLIIKVTSVFDSTKTDETEVEVNDPLTIKDVSIQALEDGEVVSSVGSAFMDDVVVLTIKPNDGMTNQGAPKVIYVNGNDEEVIVSVEDRGNRTFAFVMPDFDVYVTCNFESAATVYTITFNSNGGSAVAKGSASGANNFKIEKPQSPTKDGQNFAGWYKDTGLTQKWDFANDGATSSITLNARWVTNEEQNFIPTVLSKTGVPSLLSDPKTGGGDTKGSNLGYEIKTKSNLKVTAIGYPAYPIKQEHAIYIYDMTVTDPAIIDSRRYVMSFPSPVFIIDTPKTDAWLVAKVIITPETPQKDGYYCAELVEPVILNEGHNYYIFSGERDDPMYYFFGMDGFYKSEAATIISDRMGWHLNSIPTFYNSWSYNDLGLTHGDGVAVGQTFWFVDVGEGEDGTYPTASPTQRYNVTFNLNGGDSDSGNLTQSVLGGSCAVEPNRPTLDGYVFAGWATIIDGKAVDIATYAINGNTTFYAKWLDEKFFSIVHIEVKDMPKKTSYRVGERFDPSGMTILVHYTTGVNPDVIPVTSDMITGWDSSTPGEKYVSIHHRGNTTSSKGGDVSGRSAAVSTEAPDVITDEAISTEEPIDEVDETEDIQTLPKGSIISENSKTITIPRGNESGTIIIDGEKVVIPPGMTLVYDDPENPLAGFEIFWENPFKDISEDDWFYEYIMYVYTHGYMSGISEDEFAPGVEITRGMIVTILYNIAGRPDASDLENPFEDVDGSEWYADPIKWAYANDIISGYGDGNFGPENEITRQDLLTILMNYVKIEGIELSIIRDYEEFIDEEKIAEYSKEAIEAFFMAGIVNGYPNADGASLGEFKPHGFATRAEAATIIKRLMEGGLKE